MRINTNVSSLNAWRNLSGTDNMLTRNLERLSSGYRVNRAADDAAGLAVSEKMRAQIKGINQAVRNAQDGISMVQTAEGALTEVHSMLQRMRELGVQAGNDTLQADDRKQIQSEMDQLTREVTRITNATQFNAKDLINGSLDADGIGETTLQIGPNNGQTVTFGISAMDAKSLGLSRDVYTGVVDNGTPGLALGTTTVGQSITDYGEGLANKAYNLFFDDTANKVYLRDGSTVIGSGVTTVGATWGTTEFTVGDTATGEYVKFLSAAADPEGTGDKTDTLTVTNMSNAIASIDEVGAGLASGDFQVKYDNTTNKLQLQDSAGTDIGAAVTATNGGIVTLGDANTAKTVKVTLRAAMPAAAATDWLEIGTSVGRVRTNPAGANAVLNDASRDGVLSVGTGLTDGTYRVNFSGGNVQLQNSAGAAIGAAKAFVNGGTLEIGDAATNRTVKVTLAAAAPGAPGYATIKVTNNEQDAQAASFSGGVKQSDSKAFAGLNVMSSEAANLALTKIDTAIDTVSNQRAALGSVQNRLEHTISNLQVISENLSASESRIRDVDMALEMTYFSKNQILMQAGTAMLAQANSKNQAVLSLLR